MEEIQSFNQSDVLVDLASECKVDLTDEIRLPLEAQLLKTVKQAKRHFRESGSSILCVTDGVLSWTYKGKRVLSPIMICPVEYQLNKIKNQLEVTYDAENAVINPFLVQALKLEFDLTFPEMNFGEFDWSSLQKNWHDLGLEVDVLGQSYLGNFHHHRFDIVRDLEALQATENLGANVVELLDHSSGQHYESLPLTARSLFPSDADQTKVYQEISDKNVVLHGPPGTGKSQVLTNTMAKILYGGLTSLVVSEKRAALEVLKKKLSEHELDRFLFFPDQLNQSKSVLKQLKANWEYIESHQPMKSLQLELSSQLLDSLQFKLNVLTQEDLIGGISYEQFQALLNRRSLDQVTLNNDSASTAEFVQKKAVIEELYAKGLQPLVRVLPRHLLEKHTAFGLTERVKFLKNQTKNLQEIFEFKTKGEIAELMKLSSFAQMMSNEQHQPYFKTLNPTGIEMGRFNRYYKLLQRVTKEIELYVDQAKNWKEQPTLEEAEGLLELLDTDTFFKRYRAKRRVNQLLSSNFIPANEALKKWVAYQKLLLEKVKLEGKLLKLGVSDQSQMDWINTLQSRLDEAAYKSWKKSSNTRNNLLSSWSAELHILYQNLRTFFQLEDDENIDDVFVAFDQYYPDLLERSESVSGFSELLYKHIGACNSMEELELQTLKNNWVKFVAQYSAFRDFDFERMKSDVEEIIQLQNREGKEFAEKIKNRIHQRFQNCQQLLQIGTKKLSKQQREYKTKLKKGRAILVKEFGKTKAHPTLRELLDSDAVEWIKLLMPIWLLNPEQVANCFPAHKEQFDFALFDEASQIPLAHGLGAVQRAKRILVAGDDQQMSPQFYFKSGDSQPLDLLHVANFSWKKLMLKHHYRSENPELIAFSNKHFYQDKLVAYPTAGKTSKAIHYQFCSDGGWINRQNIPEATKVAKAVVDVLDSPETLGVVAFSVTQLDCIKAQFPAELLSKIEQREEENTLFFRSLENLQGEECDQLFVSTGYGPNEAGKVLLNFGPLNRFGGEKRLNVLFSRAKRSIHVFTSLKAQDLVLSQNDALNLLRTYLIGIEGNSEESVYRFPHGLSAQVANTENGNNRVSLSKIFKSKLTANDLVTLHRVLKMRKWEVEYE